LAEDFDTASGNLTPVDDLRDSLTACGTSKDGATQTDSGKWSYTAGSGKLKGIKGGGTYKGKGNPDGSVTYEIDGQYHLGK
jgi:hypothetical protein